MLALRYVGVLALTLWVGGLLVLGAIAAPAIFDVVAARQHVAGDRMLAGAIFGETLRRFHLLSYVCGFVLLGTLVVRGVLGPRPIRFAARLGVAFLMLARVGVLGPGRVGTNREGAGRNRRGAVDTARTRSPPCRVRPAARHVHRIGAGADTRWAVPAVPRVEGLR